MLSREWDPPDEFWEGIVAGRDRTGGGTWLGLNRHGVVAAVLNRPGSLGPAPGKRSRGELPILALRHGSAVEAVAAVTAANAGAYRTFNMVIADRNGALFVRGLGQGTPEAMALDTGVHIVTAHNPDDWSSPRVARHLPRFRAAPPPYSDCWRAWRELIADRSGEAPEQINVTPRGGFGTACSSLLALTAEPEWLFAAGPPDVAPFERVKLPGG
jgi:hypothetical protein